MKKKLTVGPTPIEGAAPGTWHDLQKAVRRILQESGLTTRMDVPIKTARGDVDVDVHAVDQDWPLPNTVIVECKYWQRKINKSVVHSVRSVVEDAGANTGLIVSRAGFQPGAINAAKFTNVRLLTWDEFQELFCDRWYREYMAPRIEEESEALQEYTEYFNSRILRKFQLLPAQRKEEIRRLEGAHRGLAVVFALLNLPGARRPVLPLRNGFAIDPAPLGLPADVLDATTLRLLLSRLVRHVRRATAQFDAAFGERA